MANITIYWIKKNFYCLLFKVTEPIFYFDIFSKKNLENSKNVRYKIVSHQPVRLMHQLLFFASKKSTGK